MQGVSSMAPGLQPFYDGWANYQRLLVASIRELTPEHLALRTAPHQWAVWQIAGTQTFTRQWVIWHLMEHELHHGGEISLILGTHGLPALNL
jgi:uncharacterized damage-inducible protein DinB